MESIYPGLLMPSEGVQNIPFELKALEKQHMQEGLFNFPLCT